MLLILYFKIIFNFWSIKIGRNSILLLFSKRDLCIQGQTGHITRWEKSHWAPLVWGPKQSGAPHYNDLFFVITTVWGQWPFLVLSFFFVFWGPFEKKSHQNLGSQSAHVCISTQFHGKTVSFYDSELSNFSMSGITYWSEKPDLTILTKISRRFKYLKKFKILIQKKSFQVGKKTVFRSD
jgi:hypothetical protein